MPQTGHLKTHWFHILLALADGALHGTAVMEEVLARTDGGLRLWPGMLYGSLKDLAEEGWIEEVEPPADAPTEGGKRRFYALTAKGRVELRQEVERLEDLVRVAHDRRLGADAQQA